MPFGDDSSLSSSLWSRPRGQDRGSSVEHEGVEVGVVEVTGEGEETGVRRGQVSVGQAQIATDVEKGNEKVSSSECPAPRSTKRNRPSKKKREKFKLRVAASSSSPIGVVVVPHFSPPPGLEQIHMERPGHVDCGVSLVEASAASPLVDAPQPMPRECHEVQLRQAMRGQVRVRRSSKVQRIVSPSSWSWAGRE